MYNPDPEELPILIGDKGGTRPYKATPEPKPDPNPPPDPGPQPAPPLPWPIP